MEPTNLTYESLYDILRRERTRQDLQKLNNNFYDEVNNYIKDKINALESQRQKSSIFAQKEIEKTEKQLDNAKKIIKEIYEKRESKIMQLALSFSKTKEVHEMHELLPEEKIIFDKIINILRENKENVLDITLNGKPKGIKTEPETRLIRFVQAVPKFIGDDDKEYGPFEEEYIGLLPAKTAEILINNKRAELI